ncbi:MAG: Lrp/AsnC family transcriptional regulator [Alphaproteobacteria bacterium]|nr:Lrp/AsnC family transcriptional regulator [Alphaproteobacteria bacterium]
MDAFDRKILGILQGDSSLSVAEVAERVGLSTTPCWRRIRNLQEAGVIEREAAILNPEKLNVGVTVFVNIRTTRHDIDWFEKFASVVAKIDEVVEFYRMSGDVDYLLRIVVPDIAAYDKVYKRLIAEIELSDVTSSFAMERIKHTTALPLNYVG